MRIYSAAYGRYYCIKSEFSPQLSTALRSAVIGVIISSKPAPKLHWISIGKVLDKMTQKRSIICSVIFPFMYLKLYFCIYMFLYKIIITSFFHMSLFYSFTPFTEIILCRVIFYLYWFLQRNKFIRKIPFICYQ